jgi:hypothetical protein
VLPTAALIVGILALALFWFVLYGIPLGLLAITLGVIGRIQGKRGGSNTSRATTGTILGAVALVFGILLIAGWTVLFHKVQDTLTGKSVTPAQVDARITRCGPPPRSSVLGHGAEADGTLTNPDSSVRSFDATVEFLGRQNTRLFTATASVERVAAGQTVHWKAQSTDPTGARVTHCNIVGLRKFDH